MSKYGVNCGSKNLSRWAGFVGCDIGSFPSFYLGLLSGGNPKFFSFRRGRWIRLERDFNFLEEKFLFQSRLERDFGFLEEKVRFQSR